MSDEQSVTVLSMNAAESSASFQNPIVKNLKMGSQNVELFSKTADSVSTSQVSWRLPVSDSSLLSRRLIVEFPFHMDIPAGVTGMTWHTNAALRADMLNRICTSCTVQVNGTTFTSRPDLISHTVGQYDRDDEYLHHSFLSTSPNTPDLVFANDLTGNEGLLVDNINDLRYYHFKSINAHDPSYPSRSATAVCTKTGATSANGAGAATRVRLDWTARYAVKNPLFSSNSMEFLANVRECSVTLNFDSSNAKAKGIFHPVIHEDEAAGNKDEITAATAGIGATHATAAQSPTIASSAFKAYGMIVTPSNPDMIPTKQLVPARDFYFSEQSVGTVAAAADTTVLHPAIDSQVIPSHIFISAVPSTASLSPKMTDIHAQISNLRLTVNNQTYTLSEYTDSDLYAMCCANGLKIPFYSFDTTVRTPINTLDVAQRGVGAPLCFRPSVNLGKSLVEGLQSQMKLEVRYTLKNNSSEELDWTSRVAFVYPSLITLEKGLPATYEIGVPQTQLADAMAQGSVQTSALGTEDQSEALLGGGIQSWLSANRSELNHFSHSIQPLLQGLSFKDPRFLPVNIANQFLQSATGGSSSSPLGGGQLGGGGSRVDALRKMGLVA